MPRTILIPHKRAFLAARLRDLGLLRLLERFARRPGLAVVCYHRVGDPASEPFYDPLVSATPASFRRQIRLLRDRFRLWSLDDLLSAAEGEALRIDEPTALITFDDGYRDNADQALPILRELDAPATFFLTTDFVGEGRLPWWDHVAFVVKHSAMSRLVLDRPEPLDVPLGPGALPAVIAAFLRAEHPEDPSLLAHLEDRAETRPPADAGRRLFMDWDGARRLLASGMAIGAHTVSHRRLSRLSDSEQADELTRPRSILVRELGREIATVAYPFGLPDAFNATTTRLAREAGYRLGFALRPDFLRPGPFPPFAIPRFIVMPDDSPALLRARLALTGVFGKSVL